MDIERINENTVKFYVSYSDIEKRGFKRDEIWFNRDKSEELFWDMMDEINDESDFEVEGPLWIQVHAQDKGIEVTVTRADAMRDPNRKDMAPFDAEPQQGRIYKNGEVAEMTSHVFDELAGLAAGVETIPDSFVFSLSDIDELVPLAARVRDTASYSADLYAWEGKFYLVLRYGAGDKDVSQIATDIGLVTEYLQRSNMTAIRLEEYGKRLFEGDVYEQVLHYFG